MALDPEYFQLKTALSNVWGGSESLSDSHKRRVLSILSGTTETLRPESEAQLNDLQIAIFATEVLRGYEKDGISWLNDEAREIATAFRRFVHGVGLYFHHSGHVLPEPFATSLADFICASKSHVATLNYDNLLYDSLCRKRVMSGFSGTLIDGFAGQFSSSNLERYRVEHMGWFLHLHGSPLFIGNKKLSGAGRVFQEADDASHIVLTHVRHKPVLIETSLVLNEYWTRFNRALGESESIIVFGYSGDDFHLNEAVAKHSKKPIFVIEWDDSGLESDIVKRRAFWRSKFGMPEYLKLWRLSNVLDFDDWDMFP